MNWTITKKRDIRIWIKNTEEIQRVHFFSTYMFLIKKIGLFVVFFCFLLSLIVDNDDFKLTLLKK